MKTIKNPADLEAGKWYAVGLENFDGKIDWGSAPLYKHEGDGLWTDDDGEPKERLWDPVLQMYVSMGAANEWMEQS